MTGETLVQKAWWELKASPALRVQSVRLVSLEGEEMRAQEDLWAHQAQLEREG